MVALYVCSHTPQTNVYIPRRGKRFARGACLLPSVLPRSRARTSGGLVVVVHVESGLQGGLHLGLREDDVARQTAHTAGALADGLLVHARDAAAVRADGAGVRLVVRVPDSLGRREVEVTEVA